MTGAPEPTRSARPIMVLSAAAFCTAATMRIADPMIPVVATEFGTTPGGAAVIATAFTLAYGLCQVVYGPLGDRWGKYRLIALAMTLSSLVVGGAAAAGTLSALGALRLLAGITAGGVIPLAIAYVGDAVPYERRQPVLARFLTGQILGVFFGQAVGGILIEVTGWRVAFLILGGCFLVVSVLLWIEAASPRIVRTTAPAPGVGLIVRRFTRMIADPRPRRVLIAVFVEGLLFFGALAYIGAFMRHTFGFDYATIGLLLGGFGIGGLGYILTVGPSVRRLGEPGMVALGGVLLTAGFTGLLLAEGRAGLGAAMLVIGFGFYMLHNTLQTNATQMAPETRGAAVALFALFFFVGQAFGVEAYGHVVDRIGYAPVFLSAGPGLLLLALWFRRGLRVRARA